MTTSTYRVSAELVPGAGTAALLRVVSVLHARCATVRQLTYDTDVTRGAPRVTAEVTLLNAGAVTLQESLNRNIEVVLAQVRGDAGG